MLVNDSRFEKVAVAGDRCAITCFLCPVHVGCWRRAEPLSGGDSGDVSALLWTDRAASAKAHIVERRFGGSALDGGDRRSAAAQQDCLSRDVEVRVAAHSGSHRTERCRPSASSAIDECLAHRRRGRCGTRAIARGGIWIACSWASPTIARRSGAWCRRAARNGLRAAPLREWRRRLG